MRFYLGGVLFVQGQLVFKLIKVLQHHRHGLGLVAGLKRGDDLLVFVGSARGHVVALVQGHDQGTAHHQVVEDFTEHAVTAQLSQHQVKLAELAHDLASVGGVGGVALAGQVLAHALAVLVHHGRGDAFHDRPLDGAARGEHFARLKGRGLRHHGATVGFDGDDALHGQPLQCHLHVIAVGVQGLDDLRFDEPGARPQAMLGDSLGQHIDDALDFELLGGDGSGAHLFLYGGGRAERTGGIIRPGRVMGKGCD